MKLEHLEATEALRPTWLGLDAKIIAGGWMPISPAAKLLGKHRFTLKRWASRERLKLARSAAVGTCAPKKSRN